MKEDIETRLDQLERRVARLEYRDQQYFSVLVNNRDPFAVFILDHDLNAKQFRGITDVLEDTHNKLEAGDPPDARTFEKSLLPFIPEKEKPYGVETQFIKGLLMTCDETPRWADVADHFRRFFNVPRRPRDEG